MKTKKEEVLLLQIRRVEKNRWDKKFLTHFFSVWFFIIDFEPFFDHNNQNPTKFTKSVCLAPALSLIPEKYKTKGEQRFRCVSGQIHQRNVHPWRHRGDTIRCCEVFTVPSVFLSGLLLLSRIKFPFFPKKNPFLSFSELIWSRPLIRDSREIQLLFWSTVCET